MNAYLAALTAGGVEIADDLQLELAAALAGWVAARGSMIERALKRDEEWGTTTMRPRLVAWTERFAAVVPAYPALAEPQHRPLAQVPGWWA